MFDNDKKLNLEVYENPELGLPNMVLSGDNVIEMLNPYLDLIKFDGLTRETLLKARFLKIGVPVEYWKANQITKMKSIICFYLVKVKKAKWLSFDHNALNPITALQNYRQKKR